MSVITGFLHPGEMGSSVAAACAGRRIWASENRSDATVTRAEAAGIEDVGDVRALVEHRRHHRVGLPAGGRARSGADRSPSSASAACTSTPTRPHPPPPSSVASMFEHAVDGGIVGPPAVTPGTTRLYLSGSGAADVARRWEGSVLDARVVGGEPGAASALKMCYAAWTKGTAALLLAVLSVATVEDVDAELIEEWGISQPDLLNACESCRPGQHAEGVAFRRRDGRDRGDVPRRWTAIRIPRRGGGGVPPLDRLQGRCIAIARRRDRHARRSSAGGVTTPRMIRRSRP